MQIYKKKKKKNDAGREEERRKGGKKGENENKQMSEINNKKGFQFYLNFTLFLHAHISKCNEINLSAKLSDFARNTVELKQVDTPFQPDVWKEIAAILNCSDKLFYLDKTIFLKLTSLSHLRLKGKA